MEAIAIAVVTAVLVHCWSVRTILYSSLLIPARLLPSGFSSCCLPGLSLSFAWPGWSVDAAGCRPVSGCV